MRGSDRSRDKDRERERESKRETRGSRQSCEFRHACVDSILGSVARMLQIHGVAPLPRIVAAGQLQLAQERVS